MLFHCILLIYFLKIGIAFYKEYFQVWEVSENLNTSCITAKHLFIKCFVQCLWLSSLIYLMVSFMTFAPFIDEMSCRVWKTWALCNLSMQPRVDRPWLSKLLCICFCSMLQQFYFLQSYLEHTLWNWSADRFLLLTVLFSFFCQCDIIQGHLGRGTLTEKQCLHQIDLCQICGAPYWLTIGARGPSPL